MFAVAGAAGTLTRVELEPSQGKTPRGFGIDPTGHWLLAANQDSDTVIVFRIAPDTGRLESVGEPAVVGAPVCVQFLDLNPSAR